MIGNRAGFVALLLGASVVARGEELNFFAASRASEADWRKDGAVMMRAPEGGWLISATNGGWAEVSRSFPYFPEGVVALLVGDAGGGEYALELRGMDEAGVVTAVRPIEHEQTAARKLVWLKDCGLAEATRSMQLSLWVRASGLRLTELIYSTIADLDDPLLMENFDGAGRWLADESVKLEGRRLSLVSGRPGGVVTLDERRELPRAGRIFLDVRELESGELTFRLLLSNKDGEALTPVEALRTEAAGLCGARLEFLSLPEDAATFRIQIELSGAEGAFAVLRQALVIRK